MSEKKRNLIVGMTVIGALVGLIYLIGVFGELPRWLQKTYAITIHLDSANGISNGSRVTMQGLQIGVVDTVTLRPDPSEGVIVVARIQGEYDIPARSVVRARTGLFGGGAILGIMIPPSVDGQTETLPHDGTGTLKGEAASVVDQIDRSLRQLSGAVESFTRMSDNIATLADRYTRIGDDLQALIEPRSLEAVDAGEVNANISTVAIRTDAAIREMREVMSKADTAITGFTDFINDEQMQADIRTAVANVREVSEETKTIAADARRVVNSAGEATDSAKKLLDNTDERLATLTRRYYAVADDLSKTLTQAETLLKQAQAGNGTAAQLLRDPALYNNLNDSAKNLSDTLKEMQLLIEKWKAEGLPIQF